MAGQQKMVFTVFCLSLPEVMLTCADLFHVVDLLWITVLWWLFGMSFYYCCWCEKVSLHRNGSKSWPSSAVVILDCCDPCWCRWREYARIVELDAVFLLWYEINVGCEFKMLDFMIIGKYQKNFITFWTFWLFKNPNKFHYFLDFLVVQNFSKLLLIGRVRVEFVWRGNVHSFVLSSLGPSRVIWFLK